MNIKRVKAYILNKLSDKLGFKIVWSSDFDTMALGVKRGFIDADDAVEEIYKRL